MTSLPFKRKFLALLFALGFILFPLSGYALTVSDVPNPRQVNGGWVTDMANILSDSIEVQLNQTISELEAKNGTEIAVVTVPATAPAASPKAFTTELFNTWGIGKKGQDKGVLFLTSVGDRRVEIETGYGMEGILPDAKVGQIIQTKIIPRFKQQDFEGGIVAGMQALVAEIDNAVSSEYPSSIAPNPGIVVAIIAFLLSIFSSIYFPFLFSLLLFWGAIFCFFKARRQDLGSFYLPPVGSTIVRQKFGCGIYARIGLSIYLAATAAMILLLAATGNANNFENVLTVTVGCIIPFGIGSLIATFFLTPLLLNSNRRKAKNGERFYCQICKQKMERLSEQRLMPLLMPPQRKALNLKSVEYEAWRCQSCSSTPSTFHLRTYIQKDSYEECPSCTAFTVEKSSEVLEAATYSSSGKGLIRKDCHYCDYHEEEEYIIPRIEHSSSSSSSSSDFGGGSSSSSSDFGGGSSGGGGAGGDW